MTQKRVEVNEKVDVDYEPKCDDDSYNDSDNSSGFDYTCEKEVGCMDLSNNEVHDEDERTNCREDDVPQEEQSSTSQRKRERRWVEVYLNWSNRQHRCSLNLMSMICRRVSMKISMANKLGIVLIGLTSTSVEPSETSGNGWIVGRDEETLPH